MLNWFRKNPVANVSPPPLPSVKQTLLSRPSLFTPDYPILDRYPECLLFVADEWMKDRRQNFVLDNEGAIRHGKAFTFKQFSYRTFDGSSAYAPEHINVALPNPDGLKIMGEVVSISPRTFLKLDKLRMNRVQFLRQRVLLAMPYYDGPIVFENTIDERRPIHNDYGVGIDWIHGRFPKGHPLAGKKCWMGPEKIAYIRAWMYVGIREYWQRFKDQPFLFSAIPRFKPKKNRWWLPEYFKYQNPKG